MGSAEKIEGLGPATLVPQPGPRTFAELGLAADEGFVLSRVDGHTSLADIFLLVPFTTEQTHAILRKLWSAGAIDLPGQARPAPGEAPPPPAAPPMGRKRAEPLDEKERARIDEVLAAAQRDAFTLLGVPREADVRTIKRAFYALSKEFHPDRHYGRPLGDYGPKLNAVFQALRDAFELLSDEARRGVYQATLGPPK